METTYQDGIQGYIEDSFSPEMSGEIKASFMLFEAFDVQTIDDLLEDILNDFDRENTDLTQMKFMECINKELDKLLRAHQVFLTDADIYSKNQILAVLYRLQHLEDPIPPLTILESSHPNEVKFAKIIDAYSELDEASVLTITETVEETSLNRIMEFLYQQEEDKENLINEELPKTDQGLLLKNLRDFFTTCGKENIAFELIDSGVKPGHNIAIYYPYVKEALVSEDDQKTAVNLLSFFFIGIDTFNDPLTVYRKYSEQLIHSSDRIIKIEVKITELLSQLRNYQGAQHAARSVSSIQHQV